MEKYCKHAFGYGHYPDVTNADLTAENNMESFWLGETLKYLYLLMDPDSEVDFLETVSSIYFRFNLFCCIHIPSHLSLITFLT